VPKRKGPFKSIPALSDLVNERNPFVHLGKDELDELLSHGELREFRAGSNLFSSGEKVEGIFCLLDGAVKISQQHRGRNFTVRFASTGDWVGHRSIFTRSTYLGSATAREITHAFFVPSKLLLQFFGSNTGFASHMIRQISSDLEMTEKKFLEYKDLNVPSRLISLFRALDEKFGASSSDGRALRLRLSKVEISEMIGASHEVVVRQLSKWKEDKLLSENGKRYLLSERLLNRIIRE
jgi:CRP/FNR family transcriptional regulator, polysaccharide utilization system transcription regulator